MKSFPGKIVSSSMSGSLKVPSKLEKRKDEDENKRLALTVKIGKQKVFFLHLYPKANTFYSHSNVNTQCHMITQSLVTN